MENGVFTGEVINSWLKDGSIRTSFTPDEAYEAIGSALLNTCRFNGIVKSRYSLLRHSELVGALAHDIALTAGADRRTVLAARIMGMLHDIGECIVGDVIWPLKTGEFKEKYDEVYGRLEVAFRKEMSSYVFGVDYDDLERIAGGYVGEADRLAGQIELFGVSGIADYKSCAILGRALEDPGCYGDRERISMFRSNLSFWVKDYDKLKGEKA